MNPTPPYNGWIVSPSFFKRAFAIWGHMMVVQLIIAIPIWIVSASLIAAILHNMNGVSPYSNDRGRAIVPIVQQSDNQAPLPAQTQ